MEPSVAKIIAAGLSTIALFGVGIGLGNIFSSYLSGVARNPSSQPELQKIAIFGFAVTEAVAFFALGMAFVIYYVF
ncbi:MAG: ATP synthase subunit C family protein [Alphaproteobacteria bacterium]